MVNRALGRPAGTSTLGSLRQGLEDWVCWQCLL